MKNLNIIKLHKGWYAEKRIGPNVTRLWFKTKTEAETQIKTWKAE